MVLGSWRELFVWSSGEFGFDKPALIEIRANLVLSPTDRYCTVVPSVAIKLPGRLTRSDTSRIWYSECRPGGCWYRERYWPKWKWCWWTGGGGRHTSSIQAPPGPKSRILGVLGMWGRGRWRRGSLRSRGKRKSTQQSQPCPELPSVLLQARISLIFGK